MSCGNPHFHALVAFSFSFSFWFSCAPLLSEKPKIEDRDRQFILWLIANKNRKYERHTHMRMVCLLFGFFRFWWHMGSYVVGLCVGSVVVSCPDWTYVVDVTATVSDLLFSLSSRGVTFPFSWPLLQSPFFAGLANYCQCKERICSDMPYPGGSG